MLIQLFKYNYCLLIETKYFKQIIIITAHPLTFNGTQWTGNMELINVVLIRSIPNNKRAFRKYSRTTSTGTRPPWAVVISCSSNSAHKLRNGAATPTTVDHRSFHWCLVLLGKYLPCSTFSLLSLQQCQKGNAAENALPNILALTIPMDEHVIVDLLSNVGKSSDTLINHMQVKGQHMPGFLHKINFV